MVVILLNLLIASMTDTYTNVQRDAQRDLVLDRAWIVARVEHNSMLSLVRAGECMGNTAVGLICMEISEIPKNHTTVEPV